MLAAVDLGHERVARVDQLGPATCSRRSRFASVGTRSAFAIRTVASEPPLDSGSNGHTRRDRDPVVAAGRDDHRVADRDPGDMIDRDRLLVVGQPVRRRPTEGAHRPVQTADHRRQGPVPRRDHDPEPRPRQPRAEQVRRPARRSSGPGPSPTAPTCPARRSTADTPAGVPAGSSPSPARPPGGPCGPSRRTPARRSLSNATSARILPSERSTHSSILGRNASISFGRSTDLARHRQLARGRARRPSRATV